MSDHKRPLGARSAHSHMWLFGLMGVAAGVGFLVFAPQLKAVSASLLLFAGFHLVGGFVLLASLYVSVLRRWVRRGGEGSEKLDFGWGPGWMNGLGIAAVICLAGAVMILVAAPGWWPAALALVLLGANFTVGNFIMRSFRRQDHAVLPMVELLSGDSDLVLDAGCGSGRTTIALGRAMRNAKVFAVDRFDAGYIDDGGRELLDRNLRIAGLSDRVTIETADLTALPFDDGDFDSMVSTHVYDHLGQAKQRGLDEAYRVLKPGGRFLMAVWVPGWTMFAVAAVLSFFLTPKAAWRGMAKAAGFELVDEGVCNNAWFVVMQKPLAAV